MCLHLKDLIPERVREMGTGKSDSFQQGIFHQGILFNS